VAVMYGDANHRLEVCAGGLSVSSVPARRSPWGLPHPLGGNRYLKMPGGTDVSRTASSASFDLSADSAPNCRR
jgi:hypothetical protein